MKEIKENKLTDVKQNKVHFFVSLGIIIFVACIAISLVVCSFIPKNFNINVENPSYIRVYSKENSEFNGTTYSQGTDVYNDIMNLYNDSFKTTVWGALFQGKIAKGVDKSDTYKSDISASTLKNGVYIEFVYDTEQKLMFNGKEYTPEINSSAKTYYSIAIEVKDSSNLTEVNAYVEYKQNDSSYFRYVTYAAQADLYNYINNLGK